MKLKSIDATPIKLLVVITISLFAVMFTPTNASATCVPGLYDMINGAACAQPTGTPSCLFGPGCAFTVVVNTALFVISSVAVLMLIYGGIRYILSGGDEKAVTAAKNTILYAVVGIIVAVLAYAIVNFVLTSLLSTGAVV
jgi:hypothetical protein